MADEADFADKLIEIGLSATLETMRLEMDAMPKESLYYCVDCDDEIPESRRLAQIGCKRCIECQNSFEKA